MIFFKNPFKKKDRDLSTPEKIIARFEKVALDLQLSVFGFKNKRRRKELKQLAALGANPDIREENGNNTLMLAIKYERSELAVAILQCGGDPGARNRNGKTALHMAYKTRVPDIIKPLIDHGANVNALNRDGRRPHDYALNLFDHSLLQIAAQTPGVKWLHAQDKTNASEDMTSTTPDNKNAAETLPPAFYMEHYLAPEYEASLFEQAQPHEHHPSAPPPLRPLAERLILPQYMTELAEAGITDCSPALVNAIRKDALMQYKVKTELTANPSPASEPLLTRILPDRHSKLLPYEASRQLALRPTTFRELLQLERSRTSSIRDDADPQPNALAHPRSRRVRNAA